MCGGGGLDLEWTCGGGGLDREWTCGGGGGLDLEWTYSGGGLEWTCVHLLQCCSTRWNRME